MSKQGKPVARRNGPQTSRDAAKDCSVDSTDVYEKLRQLGKATTMEVIDALEEDNEGRKLATDPISSRFNQLCMVGEVCTTGEKVKNKRSGKQAMLWRVTTGRERDFLTTYVGDNTTAPWPSADALLEIPEVRDALLNHRSGRIRKLYKRYRKGKLFRTVLKDKGIRFFMRHYDTNGRKREGSSS